MAKKFLFVVLLIYLRDSRASTGGKDPGLVQCVWAVMIALNFLSLHIIWKPHAVSASQEQLHVSQQRHVQ